jgi:hypothetical protein
MRTLSSHQVNGCNEAINVIVMDDPGRGGASHHYRVEPITDQHPQGAINPFDVRFQDGAVAESGVNGATHEALLAIVEDRLKSFQAGPYACRENAIALTKIQEAMHWLHHRTRERLARGVEGTHQK